MTYFFEVRGNVEPKRDIKADPTSGREKDYQITDFFISRCVLEAMKKTNSLIALKAIEHNILADTNAKTFAYSSQPKV